MRKITFLISLVLITVTTILSCDKDEETKPQEKKLYPTSNIYYDQSEIDGKATFEYDVNKRLSKINWGTNGDYYSQYEYNTDNELIKVVEYDNNEMCYYDSLEYNANGQLIKIYSYDFYNSKSESSKTHYISTFLGSSLESNFFDDKVKYFSETILNGWVTLEYNNEGFITKTSGYSTTGILTGYHINEYDDEGNITNEKFYWLDDSNVINTNKYDEIICEYDDKINPFKYLNGAFLDGSATNNVIKKTWIEHYGENYTDVSTFTIEYNDDNYPLKIKLDGEDYHQVFEYTEL